MKPSGSGGWSLNAIQVQKSTLEKCVQVRSGNRAGFFIGRTPTVGCPTNISRYAEYNLAWCTCDLCATCDFWTLKRDSCIKRYPSGVCPSPARETAPGFSLRGGGAPHKRFGCWGGPRQMPGDPKRKRFLAAASPHPKPQNQQRNEENAPISERPKRKSGRPAAGLAQPRDEHGADPARGGGGKHCQACRPAGRGGQRGRDPHVHEPPLAGRPA